MVGSIRTEGSGAPEPGPGRKPNESLFPDEGRPFVLSYPEQLSLAVFETRLTHPRRRIPEMSLVPCTDPDVPVVP